MTDPAWVLRAHHTVHDGLGVLAPAAIPDDLWSATFELLQRVMVDPESCRTQAIRWPRSEVSGYRITVGSGRYEVQVWWSMVDGASYVWGLTYDPPLLP